MPQAIDEFPVLFVAAACAEGARSCVAPKRRGSGNRTVSRSWPTAWEAPGREGRADPGWHRQRGWCVRWRRSLGAGDHRIAMSFSVASLRASGPIRIHDCANVATSFPNFLALCAQTGIRVAVENN
ncbi:hypothetical protein ACPA9J_22485 [Pseudomonas aeruginosa]